MRKFRHLFALLILISATQAFRAQDPELEPRSLNRDVVTHRLMSTLDHLSKQMKNPEFANYHHRPTDFTRLKSEVQRSLSNAGVLLEARVDYSAHFLATVDYDREAFQAYADSPEQKTVTPAVFDGVINASIDIAIKAGFVRKNKTDRVETKVNTIDENGQPVQDCYVWYAPFLQDNDQHKQKFDKRSTPTTDFLPAGKWSIWSEKMEKAGVKTVYLCGDDGRASREIDIPGPSK
jgi:hypothetical protein